MYLFDASSILNLIKRGLVTPLADGLTLDLALYECLNAIWKEYKLLKKLKEDIALEYVDIVADLFKSMYVSSIKGSEEEIFKLACKEKITIYDASYLYLAKVKNLVLVTDDRKLREKASKYVKTLASKDIEKKYKQIL